MKTYINDSEIDLTGLTPAQSREARSHLAAVGMQLGALNIAANALNILLRAGQIELSQDAFTKCLELIFQQPHVVAPVFPEAQEDYAYQVLDNTLADLRARGVPLARQAWEWEAENDETPEPVDPVIWPVDPQAATMRNILGPHWATFRVVATVPDVAGWLQRAGHVERTQFTTAINALLHVNPKNSAGVRHNPRLWEAEPPTMCLDTMTWGELRAWLKPRVYKPRSKPDLEIDLSDLGANRSARIIKLLGLTLPEKPTPAFQDCGNDEARRQSAL